MSEARFNQIDKKLDKISDQLNTLHVNHATRITQLETRQKGLITILTAALTAALGAIAHFLHISTN